MPLKMADLVDYILQNRTKKAFENWTKEEIVSSFSKAFGSKAAAYTVTPDGKLCGVVIANRIEETKTLHISNILTTNKGAFKSLWLQFKVWYPDWKLTGNRHGVLKEFSVDLLHKQFTK